MADVPAGLPLEEAPDRLYRIHLGIADGLDLPPWEYARAQAPEGGRNFGGRFDDPHPYEGERYRTLSLADDAVGAALEVYQSLRPDRVFEQLEATVESGAGVDDDRRPTINGSDISRRSLSMVTIEESAKFAPILDSKWRAYLEDALAEKLDEEGLKTLKTGDLLSGRTDLPQLAAEIIHDRFPDIAGVTIPSTLGENFRNYYVFEGTPETGDLRAGGKVLSTQTLSIQNPAMQVALDELQLDVALDGDRSLTVRPRTIGLDTSSLPVFEAGPNQSVMYREEFASHGFEQHMHVEGRSADGTRVLGRMGSNVLSVSREAFDAAPLVDDLVSVKPGADGVDRAQVVERQLVIDFDR